MQQDDAAGSRWIKLNPHLIVFRQKERGQENGTIFLGKEKVSSRSPRIAAAAAAAVISTAAVVFLTLRRPGPLAAARPGRSDCAAADAFVFCRSCGVHLSICAQTWAHEQGEINNDVNI